MSENRGKSDPLNPGDWKEAFDRSQKDFDAFFESKEQASPEAGFESGQEKSGFSPEQEAQLRKLGREIDAILNRNEFEGYKNEGKNKKRLDGYKNDILKQAKRDIENVDKFDAEGELMKRAQGAETIRGILAMIMIKDTANFDELFIKLDKIGSIKGSHTTYDAETLKNIINEVRKGKLDINVVTNAWRLREWVSTLLDKEKKENNVDRKKIKRLYIKLSKIYHPDNKKTGDEEKFKEINEANENDDLERLLAIEMEYEQDNLANGKKNENKKFDLNSLSENESRELDELKIGCEKLYRDLRKGGKFKDYDEAKLFIVQYLKNNVDIANELKNRSVDERSQLVDILLNDFELKLTQINEEIESFDSALTLEEISDKLKNAGADDEDIKYFFNLKREDRNDFLNSNEEDLKIRIEKLKEIRIKDDERNEALAQDELGERLVRAGANQLDIDYFYSLDKEVRLDIINLGESEFESRIKKLQKDREIIPLASELEKARQDYLKKEDEIGMTVLKLKNFFKNIIIDDKYEIEKELEEYKERYELALKNYTQAIVDIEGLDDKEEREILFRYAKFGETLNLMDARETIKFQKSPYWESFKRDLGVGTLSLVDKYKDLLGKSRKFITEKTSSKLLGIGGGAIAVGGAMSFSAGFFSGIGYVARVMGIAVATKGFYEKAETEAFIKKEQDTKKYFVDIEGRYVYMDGLKSKIDEDFKEELNLIIKNIPESAMQEREQEVRRILSSFGKAVLMNLAFYEMGKILKDSGLIEEGMAMIKEYIPTEKIASFMGIASSSDGAKVHSGPSYPPIENGTPIEQNAKNMNDGGAVDTSKTVQDPAMEAEKAPDKIGETEESIPGDSNSNQEIKIDDLEKEVIKDKFNGIEVNDLSRGNIAIIEGKGIKDSVASLLAQNSEKLTEGKMGWDPNKYKSVEEWANKRAIGIVAELKEKYPEYDFDKVSVDSKIEVDLSNKADIKVVGFDDPKHLGGSQNFVKDLEEKTSEESTLNNNENITKEKVAPEIKKEVPQTDIEKDVLKMEVEINRANTLKEVSVANILGFKPAEYAELNDISLKQLFGELKDSGNPENPNVKLKNLFNFMIENGQIDDMDKTISETIRGLSDQSLKDVIVGYESVTPEEYNVFINGLMRGEFQLGMSLNGVRGVFLNLDKIRDNAIGNQSNGEMFKLFKESVEKTGIKFGYSDNDSVKSYVMKAMIKAYENGSIGRLREALKEINGDIK